MSLFVFESFLKINNIRPDKINIFKIIIKMSTIKNSPIKYILYYASRISNKVSKAKRQEFVYRHY